MEDKRPPQIFHTVINIIDVPCAQVAIPDSAESLNLLKFSAETLILAFKSNTDCDSSSRRKPISSTSSDLVSSVKKIVVHGEISAVTPNSLQESKVSRYSSRDTYVNGDRPDHSKVVVFMSGIEFCFGLMVTRKLPKVS